MINPSLAESFNQGAVEALLCAPEHFTFQEILWKYIQSGS